MTIYELCYNFNRINTVRPSQIATNLSEMNVSILEGIETMRNRFFSSCMAFLCENVSFILSKTL